MFKLIKRMWNYLTKAGQVKFDEKADPTIQLGQAIDEANSQHNRLVGQAANVIAMQKKTERDLDQANKELTETQDHARQALLLQDKAVKANDAAGADRYGSAAQSFATRLVGLESRVAMLQDQLLTATKATDEAKGAVKANGLLFQKKLEERNQLLATNERAKMAERYNAARQSLTATLGEDVPSFDEIRDKINMRAAKAEGMDELMNSSVESGMMEVEAAAMDANAEDRLKVMRIQLGIEAPQAPAALPSAEEAIVDATLIPDSPAGVQTPVTGKRGGGASGGA